MSNTSGTTGVLDQARSAAAEAGLDPAKLAQDVGAKLKDVAEAQKNAGAEKVMGVARAIRSAAGNIEEESPQVARYVRSAASTLEGFTRDLNDRSVDEMGQAVVDMARRSPGLFFAGSMLAGFALFRFLNAAQSSGQQSGQSGRNNYSSRPQPRMGARPAGTSGVGAQGSSTQHTSSPMASPGGSSPAAPGSGAGGSYGGTSPSSGSGGYGGGAQGSREAGKPTAPTQGRGQA